MHRSFPLLCVRFTSNINKTDLGFKIKSALNWVEKKHTVRVLISGSRDDDQSERLVSKSANQYSTPPPPPPSKYSLCLENRVKGVL